MLLQVNPKLIGDGDGMIIHVDVSDPRSPFMVPREIRNAVIARMHARAAQDFVKADALQDAIIRAGYRIIRGSLNEEILTKEYKVRLKGVDAPEMGMAYGEEAKEALINLIGGKSLKLVAYGNDPYGRLLADVYIEQRFLQEILLKEGHVWHYQFFDKRPELAQWQVEAQVGRKGLWANSNPQSPWDYKLEERKKNKC
ncbi:nuclease CAN3 isoform X2 [Carex littledalei]|uniref:Nuclease CAN3 isoform X2 n=1 Tax=Carex littledalei TaxID=544730 RepID=A0A833RIX9_9POAL|nr:nuclease CAN3 isoform X2 [Carex littledalei]